MDDSYAPPVIVDLGSLHEQTLIRNKVFGTPNDGDYLFGFSLTTSS